MTIRKHESRRRTLYWFRRVGTQIHRLPKRGEESTTRPRRRRTAFVAISVLAAIATLAITAPLVAPYDPNALDAARLLQPPSWQHWAGTDELGRDILSRSLWGARRSLGTGVGAAVLAGMIGIPIGIYAGYLGSWRDATLMRMVDILLALPGIMLALVVLSVFGRSAGNAALAIAIVGIPFFARVARARALELRSRSFVLAEKTAGASTAHVVMKTILPNSVAPLIVQFVVTVATAVLLEAELSFLGLGPPPPAASWGDMLRVGKNYLNQAPYYAILPGLLLSVTILALDAAGRSIRPGVSLNEVAR